MAALAILTGTAPVDGRLLAVGSPAVPQRLPPYETESIILESEDGRDWNESSKVAGVLWSVATKEGHWVAVGELDGIGVIYVEGVGGWPSVWSPPAKRLNDVASGDDAWVTVGAAKDGASGVIVTSPNGETWLTTGVPPTGPLNAVATDGQAWIAVGAGGWAPRSDDGTNWLPYPVPTDVELMDLQYGGGEWRAVGQGTMLATRDGRAWSSVTVPDLPLRALAYDGHRWLAAGPPGLVVAVEGTQATLLKTHGLPDVQSLTHCGSWFAVGTDGSILSSPDGIDWTRVAGGARSKAVAGDADCPAPLEPTTLPEPPAPPPELPAPPAPVEPVGPASEPAAGPMPGAAAPELQPIIVAPPVAGIVKMPVPPAPGGPSLVGPVAVAALAGLLGGLGLAAWLLPYGLFTRLRPDRLLSHPLRAEVHALVTAEPGIHFREIVRRMDRAESVVRHHLKVLVEGELITAEPGTSLGRRRYFAVEVADPEFKRALAALWSKNARAILHHAINRPGCTLRGIAAATRLPYSVVHLSAQRLRQAGLLVARRDHRTLAFHPTKLAFLLPSRHYAGRPHALLGQGARIP